MSSTKSQARGLIGWTLRQTFWGRGYAAEAARAALRVAFLEMDRPHVISLIHPDNAASIRVAERIGERQVDTTEVMGHTAFVFRIAREEWEAQADG